MNYDNYKNTAKYPKKSDFTTTYYYHKGNLVFTRTPGEEMPDNIKYSVKESIIDNEAYKDAVKVYRHEEGRVMERFLIDLCKEYGVENNSKRHKVYHLAWEYGHSGGFEAVDNYFSELVELIK